MLVRVGLAAAAPVNVEVTFPAAGRRPTALVRSVHPSAWRGSVLTVRVDTADVGRGSPESVATRHDHAGAPL